MSSPAAHYGPDDTLLAKFDPNISGSCGSDLGIRIWPFSEPLQYDYQGENGPHLQNAFQPFPPFSSSFPYAGPLSLDSSQPTFCSRTETAELPSLGLDTSMHYAPFPSAESLPSQKNTAANLRQGQWTPQIRIDNGQPLTPLRRSATQDSVTKPSRHRHTFSSPSLGEFSNRQQSQRYVPIAPQPAGLMHCETLECPVGGDVGSQSSPLKRKRSPHSSPNPQLTEDDILLLRLKDEERLSWKDIALRFHDSTGRSYQVAALQMRLKRLRERMRVWTENDVQALRLAYEYWRDQKYEIIAAKMAEFGSQEAWTARQCSRKWQELNNSMEANSAVLHTPALSTTYTSSPNLSPTMCSFEIGQMPPMAFSESMDINCVP